MITTLTCQHCGKLVPLNPRNKNQKFCSSRVCQNTRRYTTNKSRANKSAKCRSFRQARNKRWRDTHPAHEYQKEYRKAHPFERDIVYREEQSEDKAGFIVSGGR